MQAAIASSSISPYMWIVSGPRSSVPLCGEGMKARLTRATFCPAPWTPASGGIDGTSLAAGARWSFRGKDAGSARSRRLRVRLRTRPRGEQRVPAAQPSFRRARPLNQDVEGRLVRTALLDQLAREVQVDVLPGRESHRVARVEARADQLLGAPVLDAIDLRLGDDLCLCRSHVPGIR